MLNIHVYFVAIRCKGFFVTYPIFALVLNGRQKAIYDCAKGGNKYGRSINV
jgi:hypothetical protein